MDYSARQKKLRDHIAKTETKTQSQTKTHAKTRSRFDALLIWHLPNIRYLCGFTGSAGFLLVEESGSVFFTDVRYDTQAHEEVKGAKVVIARKAVLQHWGTFWHAAQAGPRRWTSGSNPSTSRSAEKKRLAS